MADVMEFPNTWEEYEKIYGFNDIDQVYTNGSRLIPSFRVKQWLDHIADRKTEPQRKRYYAICDDGCNWAVGSPQCEGCKILPQTEWYAIYGKDEPQNGYCNECKWYGDKQVCGRCRSRNLYAPKTEPQTYITEDRDTQMLDAWQVKQMQTERSSE